MCVISHRRCCFKNWGVHMKINKESKTILLIFLIVFAMILLTSGFEKGLIAVSAVLFCGVSAIVTVWLIGFLVGCILLGSFKEAWIELNPVAMIKAFLF